jgi:hypothetical protein
MPKPQTAKFIKSKEYRIFELEAGISNRTREISKNIPLSLNTNEEFEGTLTLKNIGSATWTQSNVVLRITLETESGSILSGGQGGPFLVNAPSQISCRQDATFLFLVNAPNAAGNYILKT